MRVVFALLIALVSIPTEASDDCLYVPYRTEYLSDKNSRFKVQHARPAEWWVTPWKRMTEIRPGEYRIDYFKTACDDDRPPDEVINILIDLAQTEGGEVREMFVGPRPKRN